MGRGVGIIAEPAVPQTQTKRKHAHLTVNAGVNAWLANRKALYQSAHPRSIHPPTASASPSSSRRRKRDHIFDAVVKTADDLASHSVLPLGSPAPSCQRIARIVFFSHAPSQREGREKKAPSFPTKTRPPAHPSPHTPAANSARKLDPQRH